MNLIAPPAFTDHSIRKFRGGAHGAVREAGESAPEMAALDGAPLVLAAILVTRYPGVRAARHTALNPRPPAADNTWVRSAHAHGADADEPVAAPAALVRWKSELR
jgi:hypothetical protein